MNRLLLLTIFAVGSVFIIGCGDDADEGTCSDGLLNQDETEIDCGGVCSVCNGTPVVTITSPVDGQVITTDSFILSGNATDDEEIVDLSFRSGTPTVSLDGEFDISNELDKTNIPFSLDLSVVGIPPGDYVVIFTATDNKGVEGSGSVTYTIQ